MRNARKVGWLVIRTTCSLEKLCRKRLCGLSGLGRVASHVDIYPCNTVFIYFAGNFSTQAIRTMTVDEVLSGDNSVRTNDMSIQYSDIRARLQFLLDHIYRPLINR